MKKKKKNKEQNNFEQPINVDMICIDFFPILREDEFVNLN